MKTLNQELAAYCKKYVTLENTRKWAKSTPAKRYRVIEEHLLRCDIPAAPWVVEYVDDAFEYNFDLWRHDGDL